MLHRNVFTVTNLPLELRSEKLANGPPGLDAMMKIYDELTAFAWIKEWKSEVSRMASDQTAYI